MVKMVSFLWCVFTTVKLKRETWIPTIERKKQCHLNLWEGRGDVESENEKGKESRDSQIFNKQKDYYFTKKKKQAKKAYPGCQTIKNSKKKIIIIKIRIVVISGAGNGGDSWEASPPLYLGNSDGHVLTCTNELHAPFPLYFISHNEKHYRFFFNSEGSLAIRKDNPVTSEIF